MKRNFGKILVFMLIMSMLVTSAIYFAEPQDKTATVATDKIEIQADLDKNKLFDNLEEKLNSSSENDILPVIIVFNEEIDSNKKDLVKKIIGDTNPKHEYKIIPGMAVELTKGQINAISKLDFVKHVEFDMPVYATLDKATYWYGADKAVTDFGVTGDRNGSATSYSTTDIVVAVIDTGIDAAHVDLDGGKVIAWKDYINNLTTPYDDNGHGTHCSSIVAGTGEGNSLYKGVASGAALVGVKVLDANGSGSMSNVTAGIDWVVTNKATYGIEVISLSLGTSGSSDGTDATSLAVNNAVENGIVCFVAAGNEGPAKYTIGAPGAAANAITVGNMADVGEKGFYLAYSSSRGPTADGRIKPDIVAPGVNIMAATANSTNGYQVMSGTSMATPFTAGTAALMLDANPNLTPAQIKNTIATTAIDWATSGQDIDYGYGRLDAFAAVKLAGNYTTGTNIAVPAHMYTSGTINTVRKSDYYTFNVTNTSYNINISLIMPNWTGSSTPDFDIYLYNPSGTQVASGTGSTRQESISFTPTTTGTYKIKVYSYAGTGSYFFDISAGGSGLVLTGNDL
ncbi:MAG: S8 family serine peptidase [Lutisporaceae bacterium]